MRDHSPCPQRQRRTRAAVPLGERPLVDEVMTARGGPPSPPQQQQVRFDREEVLSCIQSMTTFTDFEGRGCFFGVNNHGVTRAGGRVPETPLLVKITESAWKESLSKLQTTGVFDCKAVSIHADDPSVYVEMLTDLRVSGPGSDAAGASHRPVTVRYWGLELADNEKGEGTGDPRAQALCNALTGTRHPWPYVYVYAQIAFANQTESLQREPENHVDGERLPTSTNDVKRFGAGLKPGFLAKDEPSSGKATNAPTPITEGRGINENEQEDLATSLSRCTVQYNVERAEDGTHEAMRGTEEASRRDFAHPHSTRLTKYEKPLSRSLSSAEAIDETEDMDTRTTIARNSEHARAVMSTSRQSSRPASRAHSTEASPIASSATSPPVTTRSPVVSCENVACDDQSEHPSTFTLGASLGDV